MPGGVMRVGVDVLFEGVLKLFGLELAPAGCAQDGGRAGKAGLSTSTGDVRGIGVVRLAVT